MGDEGKERRRKRRENRVWNDNTWFWQDEDRTGFGQYDEDTEGPVAGFDPYVIWDEAEGEAEEAFAGIGEDIEALGEKAQGIPTFTEWLQQQGKQLQGYDEPMAGLQGLIDRFQAGPTEGDYDQGFAHAARLMGLSPEEADELTGTLTAELAGGPDAQEGMTEEEMALRRRADASTRREMEVRARRLVEDTFADTGSTARMLETAAEANRQINNVQLQQDMALGQEYFERQMANFEGKKQTWEMMLQTKQIGVEQYLSNLRESASLAFQGYAQQMQAIYMQNQEVFQAYTADLQGVMAQIDASYKAITLEIGATQAELDYATQLYQSKVQPYIDALNAMLIEQELTYGFDDLMGTLGNVLAVTLSAVAGFVVGGPGGAIAGGVAGILGAGDATGDYGIDF